MIAKYLIGKDGAAPILVNLARGAVEVAVLAMLAYLGTQIDVVADALHLDVGQREIAAGAAVWLIARGAGLADQFIDPTQNRVGAARGARIGTGDQGGPPSPQLGERGQSTVQIVLAVLIVLIFLIVAGIIITVR